MSDTEKDSVEFGLQVGQAIQYEWFKKDGSQARMTSSSTCELGIGMQSSSSVSG